MFAEISFQKVIAVIMGIIVLIALLFSVITRNSYSTLSRNKSELSKARVQLTEDWADEYNSVYSQIDYDMALAELEQSENIFYAKCIDSEPCYGCIKYTMQVIKTFKGNEESSKEITLYQWVRFDFSKHGATFVSNDNSLPMKVEEEYLIFANKRNYYKDYQKALGKNEYSLCLSGSFPTALSVNESQDEYIKIKEIKDYSNIEDCNYMCFDKASLKNVNKVSRQIINHYLKLN